MKQHAAFVKHWLYPFFVFAVFAAVLFIWKAASPTASAVTGGEDAGAEAAPQENYDIRTDKSEKAQRRLEDFIRAAGTDASSIKEFKKRVRQKAEQIKDSARWNIEFSAELGAPEIIAAPVGKDERPLTGPDGANRTETLRRFLKQNSDLFGLDDAQIDTLEMTADYANPDGRLAFVHLAQKIGGVPVFRGEVKAGFTKRGEMFRVINDLAPGLDYENPSADFGSAERAVSSAARYIGLTANESLLKRTEADSDELKIVFERGRFADRPIAEKIYFPVAAGAARAAWRVLLWTRDEAFHLIIDAETGELLWRKNLTERQTLPATYNVYGNDPGMLRTADSPTPCTPGCSDPNSCPQPPVIARQDFTLIGNETPNSFNDLGWIPDDGLPVRTPADPNITDGNNCEAGIDRDGVNGVDSQGHAVGNPFRVFSYNYNPAPGNPPPGESPVPPSPQPAPPTAFQQGATTHGFYLVNRWHDELYKLGFNEAAGNFQHFNFGRGGAEGDRISLEIQDSAGTNGANFSTLPDGMRGRLQMFIWTGSTPPRDGSLDSQVVVHEITHGLSGRLHANASGLSSNMARAMGEGWSDFYALALLSEPTDDPCGIYPIGGYVSYQIVSGFEANHYYGIRRFPVAKISCVGPNNKPHNPLTFRYLNADCNTLIGTTTTNPNSAFPRGPIGTTTCDQTHNAGEIWANTLWEVRDALIARHGAAEGNRRALQYITDGMKLSPPNPTFLQSRDAILAAAFFSDQNDVSPVWEGFRRRGMGFSASIQNAGTGTNNTVVTEAFDIPNAVIGKGFSVSDAPGNGDGYFEPGEPIQITVPLTNNTGAALMNVSVAVNGGAPVSYGTINNGETVSMNIDYAIPPNAPCPGSFDLDFTIVSQLGTGEDTRSIMLGVPAGGPPIEFTNSTPIDLPSGQPTTTSGPSSPYPSTINVSGLSGNKTVKVKLNGFHHEFEDDVDLLLVGPNGQKYILMSDVGGATEQLTPITFTISDSGDELLPDTTAIIDGKNYKPSNVGANDPFDAPAPAAPYSNAAPAGSDTFASVFGTDGAALNGTWSLYGDDDASGDPGRIDGGWSLIFESADYTCTVCRGLCPGGSARADFDGDGRTDLSVFRPAEGNWYLQRSTDGFTAINWGLAGDVLTPGDFDGDGRADTAVKRDGDWYVLRSADGAVMVLNWGLPPDKAVAGDFDGDGRRDAAVYRPAEGNWYVLRSADGGNLIFNWGLATDVPVPGDFDGDGKTDLAVYRDGVWYISASADGIRIITFGLADDMPVPGDYDGDGRDDIAVFRPSDGYWYILYSSNEAVDYIHFGLSGDVPVPGDYDGDGRDDQAVYRGGVWYLNQSTNGFAAAQFGLAADAPVPKAYIP
jgi:hypothetical protein